MVRALAEDSKRSFWALADQGIVSLGNFSVNIALARHFDRQHQPGNYGLFWVFMELILFLNGVQSALWIYPLTLHGPVQNRRQLSETTAHALLLTLLISPPLILSLLLTAWIAKTSPAVGWWAGVAMLCWQLQETTRRALMSHLRFRCALFGDAISYLGQFGGIVCLARWGHLNLPQTFQIMAATSALACIAQIVQVRVRTVRLRETIRYGIESWRTGIWILLSNLTNVVSGTLFNWNFAYWAGLDMLGVYYAVLNLLRFANPLAICMSTLITPNAAKAHQEHGLARAKHVSMRFATLGMLLLTPYLGLLLLWPEFSIRLAYGKHSEFLNYAHIVQLCTIAAALIFIATVAGTFLNAIQRSKQAFIGQMAYTAAFIFIVMPMTAFYGLLGAVGGWVIAAAIRTAIILFYIEHVPSERLLLLPQVE